MENLINWFEIPATEFSRAVSFYKSILDLDIKETEMFGTKMGWHNFWIKDIQYDIDNNDTDISIFLSGNILNRYREMAVEKAIFEGTISHMEKYDKYDFEIDDIILGRNRDL